MYENNNNKRSSYDVFLSIQVLEYNEWSGLTPHFSSTRLQNLWGGLEPSWFRIVIVNLWVETPLGVAYQISCISDIYIIIDNSKKLQLWNSHESNFMVGIDTTCFNFALHVVVVESEEYNKASPSVWYVLILYLFHANNQWIFY